MTPIELIEPASAGIAATEFGWLSAWLLGLYVAVADEQGVDNAFGTLPEDLAEAISDSKTGLMVYLGQKYCAYCKKLLHDNFDKLDILAYTQKHFDAIGIDIHGQRVVTDLDGVESIDLEFTVMTDEDRENLRRTLHGDAASTAGSSQALAVSIRASSSLAKRRSSGGCRL